MNARTEAERSAGASSAGTAELGQIYRKAKHQAARGGAETLAARALERTGERNDRVADDRLSLDPLRATDRYRLVMPYTLGL